MHLEFDKNGKARPDHWVVVDDFGMKHDASHNAEFGGYAAPCAIRRREFLHSEDHDPDVNRAFWCWPRYHRACESAAFASQIGMSIEAEIRVEFEVIPAWDEAHSQPLLTQAEGAEIRIIHAGINEWEWSPASTSIAQKALEAFCWAYVELEHAREDAGRRGIMEAEQ